MAVEVKEFWAQFPAAWTPEALARAGLELWAKRSVHTNVRELANLPKWVAIARMVLTGKEHDSLAGKFIREIYNAQ